MAKIALIDDEPAVRTFLSSVLQNAGHDVTGYPNGRAGIEELQRERVDLLITDIFMPEMEGLETIRRAHALRPEMPIVAISGSWHGADYLWVAREFGAVETIEKPCSPGELLAKVGRLLGEHEIAPDRDAADLLAGLIQSGRIPGAFGASAAAGEREQPGQ